MKDEIKAEAEHFFRKFLSANHADFQGISVERLESLLDFRCSTIDHQNLVREVTDEEVRSTLFAKPNNKSLGPDGYTCKFFKAAWQIIGKDFIVAIQSFFIKGLLPKGINSTVLALIPKREEAREMKD